MKVFNIVNSNFTDVITLKYKIKDNEKKEIENVVTNILASFLCLDTKKYEEVWNYREYKPTINSCKLG